MLSDLPGFVRFVRSRARRSERDREPRACLRKRCRAQPPRSQPSRPPSPPPPEGGADGGVDGDVDGADRSGGGDDGGVDGGDDGEDDGGAGRLGGTDGDVGGTVGSGDGLPVDSPDTGGASVDGDPGAGVAGSGSGGTGSRMPGGHSHGCSRTSVLSLAAPSVAVTCTFSGCFVARTGHWPGSSSNTVVTTSCGATSPTVVHVVASPVVHVIL